MLNLRKSLSIIIIIANIVLTLSCDIIDEIIGGDDEGEISILQEQSLLTVISLQDSASTVTDALFTSGMDTLSVIDSLANFFSNDTSIQVVIADSEGVAVEYKNGIRGGIFLRKYISEEVDGPDPGELDSILNDGDLSRALLKSNSTVPIVKNSIFFDGAYPQFRESVDEIVKQANIGFSNVGIEPFKKYQGREATIDILSTLDQYGIIHLGGHGWRLRKTDGFAEDYVTYLLTGEKVELNKTYGELWNDILEKNIIIVKYHNANENRYWVSPKFVANRNDFHGKNAFIYGGFCYSVRGWMKEMVSNSGAKVMIGYKYQVKSNWEEFWAVKMYKRMCDISNTEPMEIGDCIRGIINEPYGYHYFRNTKPVHMLTYNAEGKHLSFWEIEPPFSFSSIRFEYVLDTYWDPSCFANDNATNDYFDFDQYALLVTPINLSINKIGNTYSGSWNAFYDWGDRWHTGSISFNLNEDKTKAAHLDLIFASVNSVTNSKSDEYNISLKDIDCAYSDTEISLSVKNKETCNHITQFDLWQDCWIYTNGDGVSNLSNVTCAEAETANTYYFIQIDLKQ